MGILIEGIIGTVMLAVCGAFVGLAIGGLLLWIGSAGLDLHFGRKKSEWRRENPDKLEWQNPYLQQSARLMKRDEQRGWSDNVLGGSGLLGAVVGALIGIVAMFLRFFD